MDDPLLVGVREARQNLLGDGDRRRWRQRAVFPERW